MVFVGDKKNHFFVCFKNLLILYKGQKERVFLAGGRVAWLLVSLCCIGSRISSCMYVPLQIVCPFKMHLELRPFFCPGGKLLVLELGEGAVFGRGKKG